MTPEITALLVGSGGLGALLAAGVNWFTNKAAVTVDQFEAITDALNKRIDDLQEEVDRVSNKLDSEQRAHEATRRQLRAALRYIRSMLVWLGGDRSIEPPGVPSDLMDEL